MRSGKVHPEPGQDIEQAQPGPAGGVSLRGSTSVSAGAASLHGASSRFGQSFAGGSASKRRSGRVSRSRRSSNLSSFAVGRSSRAKRSDDIDEHGNSKTSPWTIWPGSTWFHRFWHVTVAAALVSAFTDPLEIAFVPQPGLAPYNDVWTAVSIVFTLLFAVDTAFSFVLVYQDSRTNEFVADPRRIALHYLKLKFWVDFMSWFPFEPIISSALHITDASSNEARYVSLVKFLSLLRLYRILELYEELESSRVLSQLTIIVLRNLTYITYPVHWGACIFWLIATFAGFSQELAPPSPAPAPFTSPSAPAVNMTRHLLQLGATAQDAKSHFLQLNATGLDFTRNLLQLDVLDAADIAVTGNPVSWVGRFPGRFEHSSAIEKYIYSFYVSISTFTFYGDTEFYPANAAESIFATIFLMLCFVISAHLLGSVALMVKKADKISVIFRNRILMLKQYHQQHADIGHHIPEAMLQSMEEHMELLSRTEEMKDDRVLAACPSALRRRVLRHLYHQPLSECALLRGCNKKFMDSFLGVCRIELFLPGDLIIGEGDVVDELFIIMSGRVATERTVISDSSAAGAGSCDPSVSSDSAHRLMPKKTTRDDSASSWGNANDYGGGLYPPMSGGHFDDALMDELSKDSDDMSNMLQAQRLREAVYLTTSDAVGMVPFFGEIVAPESCVSVANTRVLVLSRVNYMGLLKTAYKPMRTLLGNVKLRAEEDALDAMSVVARAALGPDASGPGIQGGLLGAATSGLEAPKKKRKSRKNSLVSGQLAEVMSTAALPPLQLAGMQHLHYVLRAVSDAIAKLDESRINEFIGAAGADDVLTVQSMVRQGLSPNVADYDGRTALMIACAKGNERVVLLLLELGADASMYDNFDNTAMYEACKAGHDNIIDIMLAANAKLSMKSAILAAQMCTSVFEGNLTMLRRLLRAGADPNACDYDKRCALHIAAAEGNMTVLKTMIEKGGAEVGFQDRWGNTAKDEALRAGAQLILQYLDSIDPNRKTLDSHMAWRTHCTDAFLRSCLEGDRELLHYSLAGVPAAVVSTGLMAGAAQKHADVVHEVLGWIGSSVLHEEVGHAMLLAAAVSGEDKIIKVLLAHGARVVPAPHSLALLGELLCHAATIDDAATLRRLLAIGVPPDLRDRGGNAPIHAATAEGNLQAVRALVEAGSAAVDVLDEWGLTPLQVAQAACDKPLVAFLRTAARTRTSHRPKATL